MHLVMYRIENFLKNLISNECSLVRVMVSTRVRPRVRVRSADYN